MSDKIDKLIEKMLSVDEGGAPDESTYAFDRYTARTTPRDEPKKEEKKESYDDWLKRQPKSNVIGIHKRKRQGRGRR